MSTGIQLGVLGSLAAALSFVASPPARAQAPADAPDSLATESLPLEPTREVRFRTEEGSWMSVDVSPDGSTLVFDLLGDLYTLPVEGGTATPLLVGPAFKSQLRISKISGLRSTGTGKTHDRNVAVAVLC